MLGKIALFHDISLPAFLAFNKGLPRVDFFGEILDSLPGQHFGDPFSDLPVFIVHGAGVGIRTLLQAQPAGGEQRVSVNGGHYAEQGNRLSIRIDVKSAVWSLHRCNDPMLNEGLQQLRNKMCWRTGFLCDFLNTETGSVHAFGYNVHGGTDRIFTAFGEYHAYFFFVQKGFSQLSGKWA